MLGQLKGEDQEAEAADMLLTDNREYLLMLQLSCICC